MLPLWSTLRLPVGAKLVGAGRHNAALVMRPGSAFEAMPLLRIGGSGAPKNASTDETPAVISDLVLVVAQRATALQVEAGALVRDLRTVPCGPKYSTNQPHCITTAEVAPTAEPSSEVAGVVLTGAASGRFFGFSLDHFATFLVPGDSLLTANGTASAEGIHIYQLSAEHLPTDYQVGALSLLQLSLYCLSQKHHSQCRCRSGGLRGYTCMLSSLSQRASERTRPGGQTGVACLRAIPLPLCPLSLI